MEVLINRTKKEAVQLMTGTNLYTILKAVLPMVNKRKHPMERNWFKNDKYEIKQILNK